MKTERVSEHIWSIKVWMGITVHVWVVVHEDGVTLVDTGMPFMAKGILRTIENLQAGPLTRILLTHGHSDHVGSANVIVDATSVPVYAHRIELPYMNGEQIYPRRKKLEHNIRPGLARPLPETASGELEDIAGLKPYLTPGHAPGHVVYYHSADNVLLAGDLVTTKRGQLRRPMPMFTADMGEAIRSSEIIRTLNPARLEVCHGEPLLNPAERLDAYIAAATATMQSRVYPQ